MSLKKQHSRPHSSRTASESSGKSGEKITGDSQSQKTTDKGQSGNRQRSSDKGDSQATTLVALAGDAELFHHDGEAFARIEINGHLETWRIGSKAFRNWLQGRFWRATKGVANTQAVQDAIGVLRGGALFEGPQRKTAVRIAGDDDCIWLDLANESWQAVRIDASGWCVVDRPDVAFIRPRGVLELPTPEPGGSLDELRALLNVESDDDWILILGWLVAAMRPSGPYPILSVNGEQGSGKSTLCRILRTLVDPNKAALRSSPRDERDLVIAASNGHFVALENLSHVKDWLSDALCRLSTGGGFGTRELFSDGEEKLFDGQRPVMLNGITELCTRSDLLDRAICLSLPAIHKEKRTTESELWARFAESRGRILGAQLDAVLQACSAKSGVKLKSLPRMADFAEWVVAAEPALPYQEGAFLRAYQGNRASANESAIESSVLSAPLLTFMEGHEKWKGTATELKDALEELAGERVVKGKDWPKRPHLLSGELKRIAPNLRRSGIDVEFGKSGRRFIRLTRTRTQRSDLSAQTSDDAVISRTGGDATGRSPDARDYLNIHDSHSVIPGMDAVDAQDAEEKCSSCDVRDLTSSDGDGLTKL